ncbi:glycosyltransferase family 2 protein [Billgrantia tianxiuensis]|jgi:glycosyltransferase involved in cell wall biosynthesis|uniref:Glycosyltransferase family 2 protein n=1 Tax=Billgrantia tianxiuensis TaxID=2497861 RepID=A0A6I6SCW8_9GAMM|nr:MULTISPECIES: glycosyltransferase family A protein [Halomonas]MCE8035040.1 glycosyltransferase family 2 protein [Halomonas sp. MCCC 1A11057]QHC48458.1 glycosyltransferase family 2 protein [Halomonas tianxiuensis]
MAFFSVVMPVRDKVDALSASLSSLFQQTFRDFEVVAVDEGSTNGSRELLERHEQKGRLRLLQCSEPDPGDYAACNQGASQAEASWLVFFEAGNMLLFDHLSRFAEAIATHSNVELFVHACQMMEGQQQLPRQESGPTGVLTRREALKTFSRFDFIHLSGVCMSRERFLALGGFPADRQRCDGDAWFWLKSLCELERIHYDDTVTSLLLLDSDSVAREERLAQVHPAAQLLADYTGRLSWREARYLHAAVNRKVLAWAMEKKRLGHSVKGELSALSLRGMELRHALDAASLLLPSPYYERLRK